MGANLKRKMFAILMTLALVVSMSTVAFAAGESSESGEGDPAVITYLDTTMHGTTAITVDYKGNAATEEYVVAYKARGGSYTYFDPTTAKSKKISGLHSGGCYVFAVAGVNSEGTRGKFRLTPMSYRFMKSASPKAVAGKKKVTFKWPKVAGATGYQIRYSTKSSLSGSGSTVSGTSKAIKAKKGKTVYAQVRPIKKIDGKTYYGSWSAKKSAKAK